MFTIILRPVLRWARRKGIRLSAYLDDLLIIAKNKQTSARRTDMVIRRLYVLGFLVNQRKSSLLPTKAIQHLGFMIDAVNTSLTVPIQKVRDLRRGASRLLHRPYCSIRNLAAFKGKAQAMIAAVFPTRLRPRNLLATKNRALKRLGSWTAMTPLPQEAQEELTWWITQLRQWNGHSFLQSTPDAEVHTDASETGWTIVHASNSWSGIWSLSELPQHINWKELMVVWKKISLPHLRGTKPYGLCATTSQV
jgi:hypothetical protein